MIVPKKVQEILDDYFQMIKPLDLLESFYLYGSISIGAFVDVYSDIDFFTVIKRNVSPPELETLKQIHEKLMIKYPQTDLMGYYLAKDELKSLKDNTANCLCFIDGVCRGYTKFDTNSVDAYQLKKYGIAIFGPEAASLDYEITPNIFNQEKMLQEFTSYWLVFINKPSIKYKGLFDIAVIDWVVLGVSRIYFCYKEKDVTSKLRAGEYALQAFPKKWDRIIRESMRLRTGNKTSYYRWPFLKRRNDVINYVKFVYNECKKSQAL